MTQQIQITIHPNVYLADFQQRITADPLREFLLIAGHKPNRILFDQAQFELMLPTTRKFPFSEPGWIFEPKWDGYRALSSTYIKLKSIVRA